MSPEMEARIEVLRMVAHSPAPPLCCDPSPSGGRQHRYSIDWTSAMVIADGLLRWVQRPLPALGPVVDHAEAPEGYIALQCRKNGEGVALCSGCCFEMERQTKGCGKNCQSYSRQDECDVIFMAKG